jgi:hypothetical protein
MSAQKLSKSQIEAKEYVDKHKLDKILNEMLNSLIYNKCEHPTIFMIKFLASKLSESEQKASGILIKAQSEKSSGLNHESYKPGTISQPSENNKEVGVIDTKGKVKKSSSSSSSSDSEKRKKSKKIQLSEGISKDDQPRTKEDSKETNTNHKKSPKSSVSSKSSPSIESQNPEKNPENQSNPPNISKETHNNTETDKSIPIIPHPEEKKSSSKSSVSSKSSESFERDEDSQSEG